jgi:hypothetical protein
MTEWPTDELSAIAEADELRPFWTNFRRTAQVRWAATRWSSRSEHDEHDDLDL